MATSILTDTLILVDDRNVSGDTNTVGLDYGAETNDDTVFSDTTRSNKGALKTAGFSAEGFFDADVDSDLFSALGVSDKIISVSKGTSIGDTAFSLLSVMGDYQPIAGAVGEIATFTLNAATRGDLERGQLLFHSSSETSTGTGSTLNAGSAATSLVAVLHVWSVAGGSPEPTLDVTVESDTSDDFTGLETTRATFTQATVTTAERITGTATSDTWWRVSYTIGGSSPDFAFSVILIPAA